jgi:hypothetical protein
MMYNIQTQLISYPEDCILKEKNVGLFFLSIRIEINSNPILLFLVLCHFFSMMNLVYTRNDAL